MVNESGLKPLGRAVLIKTYEPEVTSGAIEIPEFIKAQMASVEQRAIVIEVGEHCWPEEPGPRAKPGDKVLVTKYAGNITRGTADDKVYRLVNDRDIFCQIMVEKEVNKDG